MLSHPASRFGAINRSKIRMTVTPSPYSDRMDTHAITRVYGILAIVVREMAWLKIIVVANPTAALFQVILIIVLKIGRARWDAVIYSFMTKKTCWPAVRRIRTVRFIGLSTIAKTEKKRPEKMVKRDITVNLVIIVKIVKEGNTH